MKNRVKVWIWTVLLAITLLFPSALNVKADSDMCRIIVNYDSGLATLKMYDTSTNEPIQNGDLLPVKENGWTTQVAIEFTIANGYRIKSFSGNDQDFTDGLIEGAYGGLGKALDEDTTFELILEKVPAHLPATAGASIIAGPTLTKADPVGDSLTIDDNIYKLWAEPVYSDGKAYPKYYADGNWQFSLDGDTWYNCNDYGWGHRTDFMPRWSNWPSKTPIKDFVTQKNYYLRIQLNGRKYYSTGVSYSDAIFINSDGTVPRKDIKNPTETVQPAKAEEDSNLQPSSTAVPAEGTKLIGKGVVYRVKVPGDEIEYLKGKTNVRKVKIPATVTIDGITYKITSIGKNAFKGNKKLTQVTIGKNVAKIGKKAFYKRRNLKKIVINTKKLTKKSVGAGAFKGISQNAVVKCPKKMKQKYAKFLVKKGMNHTVKFK